MLCDLPKSAPNIVKNIVFIDIETVSCVADYEQLSDIQKSLWNKKAVSLGKINPQEIKNFFFERAAIYAEFGKIIAIGLGYITFGSSEEPILHVQCMRNHDELTLLQQFKGFIEQNPQQENLRFCAHNGKEFDFPYLCRRMIVQGIALPKALNLTGKKPWEVTHLDTMEMWKFGDKKSFTSLDTLASLFGIESSKTLMDGSQVNHFYYIENDLARIAAYCTQDIVVTVQVFLKLNNWQAIKETNIIFV